jgi:tetratricopeptide (TPR) repeat protein
LLYEKKEIESALKIAEKGQSLFPEKEEFWLLESEILRSEKKFSQAVATLKKSLNYLPKNTSILFQLGVLKHELNQKDKSIQFMEKIIQINPEHPGALNFVGYTLAEQGKNLKRAEVLIKKALQLDPDNGYYLDSLAWLFYKTNQLKQAWKKIQSAVALVQDDPIIWDHYGDIALKNGLLQKALQGYKNALKFGYETPFLLEQKIRDIQIKLNQSS